MEHVHDEVGRRVGDINNGCGLFMTPVEFPATSAFSPFSRYHTIFALSSLSPSSYEVPNPLTGGSLCYRQWKRLVLYFFDLVLIVSLTCHSLLLRLMLHLGADIQTDQGHPRESTKYYRLRKKNSHTNKKSIGFTLDCVIDSETL